MDAKRGIMLRVRPCVGIPDNIRVIEADYNKGKLLDTFFSRQYSEAFILFPFV